MSLIDAAINVISEARATAGALISRFEFRGQQIATSLENIDAAKSAIMDVDLAAAQSKLVYSQLLVQAAGSAVSQDNQIAQSLLRVLTAYLGRPGWSAGNVPRRMRGKHPLNDEGIANCTLVLRKQRRINSFDT